MIEMKQWLAENTRKGPANLFECATAQEVAEAFLRATGTTVDDSQVQSVIETLRELGHVPDQGENPRSNLVLTGLINWLYANTAPGPADDWTRCCSARAIAEGFCRSTGIPIDDGQSRSIIESLRVLGYVVDPSREPQSTLVLTGQARFDGARW